MDRNKKVIKVLSIILILNLLVCITKITFGLILNLNSLTADGFHALTDTLSNIIGIIGIKLATKPADKSHPYGYHKFETIACLIIGVFLIEIIFRILVNAVDRLINPVSIEISTISIIAICFTIILNIIISIVEKRIGEKLNSDVLVSDSIHTKSDIYISVGVLITTILIKLNFPTFIDPIVSLIVIVFIFRSAMEIFKNNLGILVDKKVVNEDEVIKILMDADSEVLDVHKIRSRGSLNYAYIDLHIITKPDLSVYNAHELSHKLERVLQEKLNRKIDLCCHIEPDEKNLQT